MFDVFDSYFDDFQLYVDSFDFVFEFHLDFMFEDLIVFDLVVDLFVDLLNHYPCKQYDRILRSPRVSIATHHPKDSPGPFCPV